ncbi:Uncharacterised protein [Bordetella pertussis]|nr:Uncharacterised protein [Bordetella pertussis]CFP70247.1 Uncharacterised protein [Bordetella pertussis]CFW34554.1 Uncharacterised protein [Bordetella pertussis]
MRNASTCALEAADGRFGGAGGVSLRNGPRNPVALLAGALGIAMTTAEDASAPASAPGSSSADGMDVGARAVNKALCTCSAWSRRPGKANPMLTVTMTAMPR